MADHRNLVSSETHEPKHISDSTASDAGKVITPLSGGQSELRNLTPSEVGINNYYLEWSIDENAVADGLTAATDTDLYTGSEYTQITSTFPSGASAASVGEQFGMSFNSTDYEVTIPSDGVYRIAFWANFKSDTATNLIGFKLFVNGTAAGSTAKTTLNNAGRVGHMSVDALSTFTAGQTIGIGIASDTTANITIQDLKAHIHLIRES